MASVKRFKIVLLGEGRVGKTSILLRYIRGEYDDRQISTLQASYLDKKLTVSGVSAQLSVWDTAGQERFHSLGSIYYRDADGALLVYDITSADSFHKVTQWVSELRQAVGDDITIAIAGNKIDLEEQRQVDEEEAFHFAETVGAIHHYTSAKVDRGLDEAFEDLTQRIITRKRQAKMAATTATSSNNNNGSSEPPKIVLTTNKNAKKEGCC